MKNFLITVGWCMLYLFIYMVANFLVSVGMLVIYAVLFALGLTSLDLIGFITQHVIAGLLVASILSVGLYYLVFVIRGVSLNRYVRFEKLSGNKALFAALTGAGIAMLLNSLMTLVEIERYFPTDVENLQQLLAGQDLLLILLTVGLVVPVIEELLFRGLIFNTLKWAMPLWLAVLIQGLAFGAVHGNWLQFIYTFPLGIYLGIIYLRAGSLWAPILVHLFWNCTSILMGYVLPAPETAVILWTYTILGAAMVVSSLTLVRTGSAE